MLNRTKLVLVIFFVLFIANALLFTSRSYTADTTPNATDSQWPQEFKTEKNWNKLDDALKANWQDAMKTKDSERRMDCFVRVRAPFDEGDNSFLLSRGFAVRSEGGNIVSGHVKAIDLPSVATLDFVDAIRSAKK